MIEIRNRPISLFSLSLAPPLALLVSAALLNVAPVQAQEAPSRVNRTAPAKTPAPEEKSEPAAAAEDDDDDDILVDDDDEPAPAEKAKVGIVLLVPVGKATKPLAEQVSKALLEEMREARFEVVPVELSAAAAEGSAIDKNQGQAELKKGKASLAKAAGLLKRLSFSRAEKKFKNAISQFQSAAAALDDVSPVTEAHLGLAEVYARQGMEEETDIALRAAIVGNPEYELDPGRFPPLFIRTHGSARDEVLSGDKGVIVVDASAKGATVFLDGRELGEAPLKIKDVPAGEHFVRLIGEGIGLYGTTVTARKDEEATVSAGFFAVGASTPLDLLAQNRFDDAAAQEVAQKAKAAGHVGTIIGVVARGRSDIPTVLIYVDTASGKVRHVDVMRFDGDLLNMAIEALAGREEIEKAMAKKSFSLVDDEALIEGEKGASDIEVPTVALRFDISATETKKPKSRSRRLGGEASDDDDDDDDDDGRKLAKAGKSGRRKTLRGDADSDDPLRRRNSNREALTESKDGGILTNPWLWTAVAGGGMMVVAAAAAAGGVGVYFLIPPTQADVFVNLPEQ